MKNFWVSILGCGWLGFPLAVRLQKEGYYVKGSTTQKKKLSKLNDISVQSFLIDCLPNVQGEHLPEFFQSKVLFLNIPFKRNLEDSSYYQKQIDSVISLVESLSVIDPTPLMYIMLSIPKLTIDNKHCTHGSPVTYIVEELGLMTEFNIAFCSACIIYGLRSSLL